MPWFRKASLGLCGLLGMLELVSAPVEWLWPYSAGGNTHWHGNVEGNLVSLTFDDGPSRYTEMILDVLKSHQVPATFFVMGVHVERFPRTVKRMAVEGHEIGNHTYSFESKRGLFKLYFPLKVEQINRTQEIVKEIIGTAPKYFRSPGGQMGRNLWHMVRQNDLRVVNGTLPFPEPEEDVERQFKTVLRTLKPGAIIILHDGDDRHPDSDRPRSTVRLLPRLLEVLKKKEYKIVSLSELLYGDKQGTG